MGFRERPEYQDWRDAVFRLFGQKCIRCGYAGNIHAHHVMPVNEYPELAFEPTNGVPLCGNCHTEVKGDELAHVDDLKRLQRAVLGGEVAGAVTNAPSELELRERAFAEPSNADAVKAWLATATDSRAVVDFYDQHRQAFIRTSLLCYFLAKHLSKLGRWQDVIEVADAGMQDAELDRDRAPSNLDAVALIGNLGSVKWTGLCKLERDAEAGAVIREVMGRFPEVVNLTYRYALCASALAKGNALLQHADYGSSLYGSALRCGKRALELASTNDEKIEALQNIADIYYTVELYADARSYLRQALEIDDCNAQVMADMAFYYLLEGNKRDALRMLKQGLLLDPENVTSCRLYWLEWGSQLKD